MWKKEAKAATDRTLCVPAVTNHGRFGRWAFLEITDLYDDIGRFIRAVAAHGFAATEPGGSS
jgi:type III restriction enzyme